MDLRINAANCGKPTPNFGMALKFNRSSIPVVTRQILKLSPDKQAAFWNRVDVVENHQKYNPVDIFVKALPNGKLKAEVVDGETIISTREQGRWSRTGSLDFLNKAEQDADNCNVINKNRKVIEEKANELPIVEDKVNQVAEAVEGAEEKAEPVATNIGEEVDNGLEGGVINL